MKATKVVHLSSVHPAFDVRIFHKECKSLARAGYEVTLVVPHERDEEVGGVSILAVGRPKARIVRMTRTAWSVYRRAVKTKADLYHFHDPELIPMGLLLQLRGSKVVYDIHEDLPRMVFRKRYLSRLMRGPLSWLLDCIEKFASSCFSGVVTATPAIARRFTALNPVTVTILNSPLLEEFSLTSAIPWTCRTPSVAYVGGIAPETCIREIVAAMALLPSHIPATLKLAGSYNPSSLREELMRHPGWARVEDLGLVVRSEIPRILGQVRVGLVLFRPEPDCVEALPNKLFEYMAAGIPVIASDFPLWRRIIEGAHCGLLVDPLSPGEIARAIGYLLTETEEAKAMGNAGRRTVEQHYNWSNEEGKLLALYADLLEKS